MSGITFAALHTFTSWVTGEVSSILTASGLEEYYSWAAIYDMLYKRENVNSPEPLKLVFGSNESSYRRRCRRVRIAHPSQPPRAILGLSKTGRLVVLASRPSFWAHHQARNQG